MAVTFSTGEAEAGAIAEEIIAAGGRACAIQADVAREENIVRLFETAERELGPIKALVNNAAITGGFARVDSVSAKTLEQVMAVNVSAAFLCAREAVRRMSTRHGRTGGAIVNISSRAARIGSAGEWVHYAASKGAIDSFTIGLAREVATEGIRVNAVAPGLIDNRAACRQRRTRPAESTDVNHSYAKARDRTRGSRSGALAALPCRFLHHWSYFGGRRRAMIFARGLTSRFLCFRFSRR